MGRTNFMLQMEKKDGYLYAVAQGERSRENVIGMTMDLFTSALDKNLPRILLDVRELLGYFGFMDIFFLVKEILLNLRDKGVEKVAVIDVGKPNRRDWFLEHVARIYNLDIRVFSDPEPAKAWLTESGLPYLH